MRITVTGTGYVGLVTGVCLAEMGHHVVCMDIQIEKIKMLQLGISTIYEPGLQQLLQKNLSNGNLYFTTDPNDAFNQAEVIFITVGTPETQNGTADLQYIDDAAKQIAKHIKNDVIICIKSTVPVGTNDKIHELIEKMKPSYLYTETISNPEFLREGSAIHDFYHGDRIVIGSNNAEATAVIEEIYLPLQIPIIKTDIRSAEMIKYASNAFLATKISFINEIATLCEKVGANIDEVATGIGRDSRIGPHFLQAGIGYGGSCFPKDTKALSKLAGNVHHPFELLDAVIKINNHQQSLPVMKANEIIGSLKGKKIALLGLAFKPGTDDIRESASLKIIEQLLEKGALVTAYDPIAISNAQKVFGNAIRYTDDIQEALTEANLAIIATEWEQIKLFPLRLYSQYMKEAIVIDGRNCYSLQEIEKYSIQYISIGRPVVYNTCEKRELFD